MTSNMTMTAISICNFLKLIVKSTVEHYTEDFKLDIKIFKRYAKEAQETGKPVSMLWFCRSCGTYKGWLTIYGTQISEPVVQGETNETYLRTNINKEHAEAGTLFLDETTDLSQDGNLIIYGHKMNDGTMFGTLDKFEDEEFFDNNGTVCWESEKGKEYYQIFALLVLPGYSTAPDFIDLQAWNNVLDEEQTADMLNTIADRASIFRGESFNLEKDKYLFLVTCDYSINNGRLVLVGRRLSKKSETEKTTEESTDSSEEAVSEEENSENVE